MTPNLYISMGHHTPSPAKGSLVESRTARMARLLLSPLSLRAVRLGPYVRASTEHRLF